MKAFQKAGKAIMRMANVANLIEDKAAEHYLEGGEDETEGQGWRRKLDLHPFNHAPSVLDASTFEALWKRHAQEMRRKHSSIIDALSGRRLDIAEQVVPLKMSNLSQSSSSEDEVKNLDKYFRTEATPVEGLLAWLEHKYKARAEGDASGPSCILLTGPPAAGKTCLMSQLITRALTHRRGCWIVTAKPMDG